ncbi:sulfur oxidation c-type cytochrome SoxX [Roseibium suaedae]|uniref:Monoheme cytochrome SoxX (Sulfur oxidation) n=1 Tax=Roseibium suaedae TaxID=735517 RepID=A0A1M7FB53_9HYPH|nr:sulfur oxidation c-type cytochrome SoxX [Roseibium suaedae]SHM01240.1 monoheme cytochrome SoxX (sulfur oxidation) [Roseibium suaedae]
MTRGFIYSIAAATLALSAPAMAGTVAPGDVVFADMSVATSMTGETGDPANGRKVFADRKKGNCLACHANTDLKNELFHGDVGPSLDGAGSRWSPEQLRAIVANSKQVFGDQTVMPGFYSLVVGKDIAKEFEGKTILSAQEVEDVVAYLTTLTD